MNKRFVTIFPEAQNIHLKKRIGMVPYILHREYNYDSIVVCFKNENTYPFLKGHMNGLGIHFLPSTSNKKNLWEVVKYVSKNAQQIDVLNLYHQSEATFMIGCLYKLLNPKGILYMTLDMNIEYLTNLFSKKPRRHLFFWNFFFDKIVNIVSYESTEVKSFLLHHYKNIANKLLRLTNGIDDIAIRGNNISNNSFETKENLIITVGRIGLPEKNNELLLAALEKINLNNWKVAFIGPICLGFEQNIVSFFQRNPTLNNKIIFTGAIYNQLELYDWYNRAKVFCLSSKREGFATVLPEAMYFGNYIVSTNVSSINDITNQGTLGSIVENESELVAVLQSIIDDKLKIEPLCMAIKKKAKIEYSWTNIVAQLNQRLVQEWAEYRH
jgi:glycosyltransferase involved in cell wall biosynthesis